MVPLNVDNNFQFFGTERCVPFLVGVNLRTECTAVLAAYAKTGSVIAFAHAIADAANDEVF